MMPPSADGTPNVPDPSPQNPSKGTPEQKQQAAGLTEKQKQQLLLIKQRYEQEWSST
jgi:hypothetical protein